MRIRNIATIYLFRDDAILLMHRVGSRLFTGDIWVGIGGHFEPHEMSDPTACVLRELTEETGLGAQHLENLRLKYITTRMVQDEIRQQYIFMADLKDKKAPLGKSDEGELLWVASKDLFHRNMAYSNTHCLKHYLCHRDDPAIYVGALSGCDGAPSIHFTALQEYSMAH